MVQPLFACKVLKLPCQGWSRPIDSKSDFSATLAQAIKMRHERSNKPLLHLLPADGLVINDLNRLIRMPNALERAISMLARKSDLSKKHELLSNMTPAEFACSFRDAELLFLLEQGATELL